ncbi:hypothetical protein NDU88_006005 [Pleurodeles waltl]|uniref:Uncharacterized protein n=1 Tax=Pleurodeles waltl TaxID=8319 RepID=A0AAV7RQ13_PLEWA|nr:hypothetical protein NDU88_006005 [Pleurodeles waltl]
MTSRGRTYKAATVGERFAGCFLPHWKGEEDDTSGPASLTGGRTGLSLARLTRVTLGGGSCGDPGLPVVMAEKRSRTDELLEAPMLRMDAMDQAIASLKAQTSSSGAVAPSIELPGRGRVRRKKKKTESATTPQSRAEQQRGGSRLGHSRAAPASGRNLSLEPGCCSFLAANLVLRRRDPPPHTPLQVEQIEPKWICTIPRH